MTSQRRTSTSPRKASKSIHSTSLLDDPPVHEPPKQKLERFVLTTGHDAHDLLQDAETELNAFSVGAHFDHLDSRDGPSPLETASDIDADDHSPDGRTIRKKCTKPTTSILHLNAIPRKGNRTRRMILESPRTEKAVKSKLPGPKTFEELDTLMKSLDKTMVEKDKLLQQQHTIYQVAINHLCEENITKQQDSIHFTTMQHEIEHMQHHVQKNSIMRVDFDEETTPRSAVYRHSIHMTQVTDMGVRIYNVEDHPLQPTDRIIVARRLSGNPSTPHNKMKHNRGRRCINQAQPQLMKNQKYIERDKEYL